MKRFIIDPKKGTMFDIITRICDFIRAFKPKDKIVVTVGDYKKNRSRDQNDFYWALITAIANETGHSKDEIHDLCRYKFLGMRSKEVAGQRIEYLPSTTKLKVGEMGDYITQIEAWAGSIGIVLPYREMG